MESSKGPSLVFRPFLPSDKEDVLSIWRDGKKALFLSGIDQWQRGDYPGEKEFISDLESGEGIAVTQEGKIIAVFALSAQKEKDYDLPSLHWKGSCYLALHRCAVRSLQRGRGLMGEIVSYAEKVALATGRDSIRIDTHGDNKAMQRALGKAGFGHVGSFLLSYGPEKGDRRIGMEKVLSLHPSDKKKAL